MNDREALKHIKATIGAFGPDEGIELDQKAWSKLHSAIKEALAQTDQPAQPVAFEEWLANQHGDPEEVGFLQALRIAYISGQDSITTPPQREWVGLTDEEVVNRANAEVFAEAFARGVAWAELKLKEKNT